MPKGQQTLEEIVAKIRTEGHTSALGSLLRNRPAQEEAHRRSLRFVEEGGLTRHNLQGLPKVPKKKPGVIGTARIGKDLVGWLAKNRKNPEARKNLTGAVQEMFPMVRLASAFIAELTKLGTDPSSRVRYGASMSTTDKREAVVAALRFRQAQAASRAAAPRNPSVQEMATARNVQPVPGSRRVTTRSIPASSASVRTVRDWTGGETTLPPTRTVARSTRAGSLRVPAPPPVSNPLSSTTTSGSASTGTKARRDWSGWSTGDPMPALIPATPASPRVATTPR
jgi:hypothetical protein